MKRSDKRNLVVILLVIITFIGIFQDQARTREVMRRDLDFDFDKVVNMEYWGNDTIQHRDLPRFVLINELAGSRITVKVNDEIATSIGFPIEDEIIPYDEIRFYIDQIDLETEYYDMFYDVRIEIFDGIRLLKYDYDIWVHFDDDLLSFSIRVYKVITPETVDQIADLENAKRANFLDSIFLLCAGTSIIGYWIVWIVKAMTEAIEIDEGVGACCIIPPIIFFLLVCWVIWFSLSVINFGGLVTR